MNKLFCLCFLLFLFSCKTTSVVVKTPSSSTPDISASSSIIDSVKAHAFQFEWFSGKAKVDITQGNDKTSVTANFRIKKDSAIWISVSPALGIEVVRMLMTKDSIRVIDRLGKKKYARSYDFFKTYTMLPVDFNTVQNMIMGNLLFLRSSYKVKTKDSVIVLLSNQNSATDSIVLSKSFQPLTQFITDAPERIFSSSNAQYDMQYTPPFSLWRKIIIRHPDEMVIELTFNKIKLNDPLKFPFKGDE